MFWAQVILLVVTLTACGMLWYLLGIASKTTGEMRRILTEFEELVKKTGGDPL